MYGHQAVAAQLLEAEAKDCNDWTALHLAAANGKDAVVEVLLQSKADPNAVNNYGRTAAYYAESQGHQQLAQRLKQAQAIH